MIALLLHEPLHPAIPRRIAGVHFGVVTAAQGAGSGSRFRFTTDVGVNWRYSLCISQLEVNTLPQHVLFVLQRGPPSLPPLANNTW
jgi:hypothetical protein